MLLLLCAPPLAALYGQAVKVLDQPLFAYAIFYNMDLEISLPQGFQVKGPVHVNGNLYVQTDIALDFFESVKASGDVLHGPNPVLSPFPHRYGPVTFSDGLGNQVPMLYDGVWIDSRLPDFAPLACQRWNGRLKSGAHGVGYRGFVGLNPYVRDNPESAEIDDPLNHAYHLIAPLVRSTSPNYNPQVEAQKFAYQAGLVIHVEVPRIEEVVAGLGRPDYHDSSVQQQFLDVATPGDPTAQAITLYRYERSGDALLYNRDGQPIIDTFDGIHIDNHFVRVAPYTASGSVVTSGIFDQRMRAGFGFIEIDVGQLKHMVEANLGDAWEVGGFSPDSWWNGIVYVSVSTRPGTDRPDNVEVAEDGWAVKLINGAEIPNPSFAWPNGRYGMTLAANVPLYVQGNFNADGSEATGSSTHPDMEGAAFEPPAALIADAITLLSNSWEDEDSLNLLQRRRTTSFTEVSAAIVAGLVPTNKGGMGNFSGGVLNLVRLLEDWEAPLRLRGSMVALFESEIATAPWGLANVYGKPEREFGFHRLFADRHFPPGTPKLQAPPAVMKTADQEGLLRVSFETEVGISYLIRSSLQLAHDPSTWKNEAVLDGDGTDATLDIQIPITHPCSIFVRIDYPGQ